MSGSYFDYHEFVEYIKKFNIMQDDFDTWLKNFLLKQAQRVVSLAKQRQRAVGAIDTGFMINSWVIGNEAKVLKANSKGKYTKATYDSAFAKEAGIDDIKVVGNNLEVTIGNTAEYSSFIEFGQRSYSGKYLLTISIDTVARALPSRFETEFVKFLKEKGVN